MSLADKSIAVVGLGFVVSRLTGNEFKGAFEIGVNVIKKAFELTVDFGAFAWNNPVLAAMAGIAAFAFIKTTLSGSDSKE